jgi:tetratricopeptide (TPR) repeat protein
MWMAWLSMVLGGVICFSIATVIEPWYQHRAWEAERGQSMMEVILGESRRLFANHFYVKADVYFHSGYYPSVFDESALNETHHLEEAAIDHSSHGADDDHKDELPALVGVPKDCIYQFGEYFKPSRHIHLNKSTQARELIPWLKLAAELDPHRIETYTVAAYWLRSQMKKNDEAAAFLREGWSVNPDSYEILFELGLTYWQGKGDALRARNVWELALRKWQLRNPAGGEDRYNEKILLHLAKLEEQAQRWEQSLRYFQALKAASPHPEVIQKFIDEIQARLQSKAVR